MIPPLNAVPTELSLIAYSPEEMYGPELGTVSQIKRLLDSYQVTWISVIGLQNIELIQEICIQMGVHRLTIEDIINQNERPKVEHYETYIYISVHVPRLDGHSESDMISILLGERFVMTFQNTKANFQEAIRNRIQKKIGQIRFKNSEYLSYAIIDGVIDLYFPAAEHYAELLDTAEEDIIQGLKPIAVLEIYNMRSRVNYCHRILWSHKELINRLLSDPESPIGDDVCVYLRDCFDHTIQILDFLENLKETSKTLIDLHLSLQSHRSNEIIKFLTIITATFIPMTFISGLYGMNFDRSSPWNMPELHWQYGYPFALVMMVCSAGSLWLYFYKQNWFSLNPATKRELEHERDRF